MMRANGLIILVLMLLFFTCRREKVPNLALPPITQTGQNTLGFLLDQKVWTNYGRRCTFAGCKNNKVLAYLYKQPNGDFDFGINAGYTSDTVDQYFYITTTNVTSTGTYLLESNLKQGMTFIGSRYAQWYREYLNIKPNKCVLTITRFDTVNRIIAGTFTGVLYNSTNGSDSVKILDGRFDAQLDYRK